MVLVLKKPPANARDVRGGGSIPGLGRSPGGGNGNALQYSGLGNPVDRGAWRATVQGVAESDLAHTFHMNLPFSVRSPCASLPAGKGLPDSIVSSPAFQIITGGLAWQSSS